MAIAAPKIQATSRVSLRGVGLKVYVPSAFKRCVLSYYLCWRFAGSPTRSEAAELMHRGMLGREFGVE